MEYRGYDPARDRAATHRIWHEIGWIDPGQEDVVDLIAGAGRAIVAELNGEAECMVAALPGTISHLDTDLPFGCVHTVTTGRVARKQGLASRLTAAAVAGNAAGGALVQGLGMFEQGYYNRLGFGTGSYKQQLAFDPFHLRVSAKARPPRRLGPEDWEAIHASRLARRLSHGGCNILPAANTRADILWGSKTGFGLGYCDGPGGELTHHVYLTRVEDVANGPYSVGWLACRTREQFLELMALVKGLGDQVRLVTMAEPPGIQLQDMIERPFAEHQARKGAKLAVGSEAFAWWQMRINDLPGCLEHTHLCCEDLRFNLSLADPIERYLDEKAPWRGISGEYVVTLGEASRAEVGTEAGLPTLAASVNAFTRLWLGVRPATGLATTDELHGPDELLEALDRAVRVPSPQPDWGF